MDLISRIGQHFTDSAQTKLDASEMLAAPISEAANAMVGCLLGNGKILACGNGGSAADAQHFAAELVGRFEMERQGLAAIALRNCRSSSSARCSSSALRASPSRAAANASLSSCKACSWKAMRTSRSIRRCSETDIAQPLRKERPRPMP